MPGQKTTTTQSSAPWAPAQPALQTALNDAQTLYRSGVGSQVNTASNVVPMSGQTTAALGGVESMARANMGGQGLSGQMQGVINAGGFTPGQSASMGYLNTLAGSNPFDLSGNEAFQTFRTNALGDVADRTNAAFSAAGRYGSGAHGAGLGNALGRVGNEMDMAQFGRMDAANINRGNLAQQGFQNMGAAFGAMQQPMQALRGVGAEYEDLAGRMIDDRNRIFDAQQNAPWEQLGRLNAIASGAGQMGGTSSGTVRQPSNMFGQIGGGLLGLSGLFGR